MKKFKYIDAIRGIAILGVFVVHVLNNKHFPLSVQHIFELGAKGVQLFFIASAFTLFLSMSKRGEKERYPTGNFFIRRFFRIAPMYYLAIIYYYYQNNLAGVTNPSGIVTANFLFIHGLSPHWINYLVPGGWSITVEMMFYCIVPFIFGWISNINKALLFLTFTLCFRIVFLVLMRHFVLPEMTELNHDFFYWCLPNQLPIFALGILLFFYVQNEYSFKGLTAAGIGAFLLVLVINCTVREFLPNHVFITIGFIAFFAWLSRSNNIFFVNRFTVFLGKISFSLYLVHFAVNFWVLRLSDELHLSSHLSFMPLYLSTVVIVFLLSTSIALFFYHVIEVRFQQVGKMLIQRREAVLENADGR